jgi:C4-dicarboxylate transporter
MDSAFRIPGTGFRVGWDGILGLIPGIGDAAALAPALYILWRAQKLGAPPVLLGRMAAWVAADTAVGAVPVIGDIFDIGLKANRRNVALLRDHLGRSPASPPPGR